MEPGMKDFERDYLDDPTRTPGFEHGDEIPSNFSANPTFYEIVERARADRRSFLFGGLAAAVTSGMVSVGLGPRAALAQSASTSALLGFAPVPISKDDTVVVPAGYKVQVFAPWGTPLLEGAPAYAPGAMTGAAQQLQVGTHHDAIHYFPIDGSSTDGLLVMNHEYIEPRFFHAVKWAGQEIDGDTVVLLADGKRDDDEVLAEAAAHGVSVMRIQRGADGQWAIVADPHNRRIHALTEMALSGPAAGSAHMITKYSPDGTRTRGTLNNCAYGSTPWNTYLTAEENWAGYFVNKSGQDLPREQARYGVPDEGSRYLWELAASGADEYVRFDVTPTGASAAEDYRNEANTYGWIVEIDPFDPASTPVKRTHLGRFAHEGVVFHAAEVGQPVVCYSGDDSRFEYIYKFVSSAPYAEGTRGEILDEGTLYAAKFNADGTGEWLALAPGQNGLTPENGFADLADILVNTRAAADQAGATKMDRPEWGTIDHATGEVYFTLTNNNRRTQLQVDAVNPRAENNFGSIVRWKEAGGDFAATTFEWNLFVLAGTPVQSAVMGQTALNEDNMFACPDGMWCDQNSRLWIQTDMGDISPNQSGPLAPFGMNAMLAADPTTGEIRRFLTGPWGQEITGVITTPDGTSMFVNVQHPGAQATAEQFAAGDFGSGFPDYDGSVPRSATIIITREDGGIIGA
jgi:hypothetical protein